MRRLLIAATVVAAMLRADVAGHGLVAPSDGGIRAVQRVPPQQRRSSRLRLLGNLWRLFPDRHQRSSADQHRHPAGWAHGATQKFVGAENGETISENAAAGTGRLLGIVAPKWWPIKFQNWFNNLINEGFTGVNATVELAGSASNIEVNLGNLLFETGTALSLPVKIKLSNAILGSNCYLGSNSNPIVIDFTSGETSPPPPNEPIHGSVGEFSSNEAETLLTLEGGQLVNNSYAAPGASGCGGIFSRSWSIRSSTR